LEIVYHDSIPSTHRALEVALREGLCKAPIAYVANHQSAGVGSRGNRWQEGEGNLYLSFALLKDRLPDDLPLASTSIYFSFIMIELLRSLGSLVWLKWPNDFYLGDKKVGGTITTVISGEIVLVSMGINLQNAPKNFETIDIVIEKDLLIEKYFLKLKQVILWKDIFRQYQIEFEKSRHFFYTDREHQKKVSLRDATLLEDGSIMIENRRVYSLR
jgi:BirA family biotin operon repressor/biotin-[acetyl-CoA-carboxylase] ligase